MSKLCNIDIGRSQEIFAEIKNIIKELYSIYNMEKVYLFGSFVKGEIHEGSNIYLIIVGDFTGKMFVHIAEVLKFIDLPISPFIYSKVKYNKLKKRSAFIKEVLKTAKLLKNKS
jgi:predicted nucleotidyltransferase